MVNNHYRWDFIGLSTDVKPTPATSERVTNGSTFYCSDNSKLYIWYHDQWYEKTATGGGGGGGGEEIKKLTTADYNYDNGSTGSFNTIGLWLLDDGIYELPSPSDVSMLGALQGYNYTRFNSLVSNGGFHYLFKQGPHCWFLKDTSNNDSILYADSAYYWCRLDKSTASFLPDTEYQLLSSQRIATATGSSNSYAISQGAVTTALGGKVDKSSFVYDSATETLTITIS